MDYNRNKRDRETEFRRKHINLDFALKPEGLKPVRKLP